MMILIWFSSNLLSVRYSSIKLDNLSQFDKFNRIHFVIIDIKRINYEFRKFYISWTYSWNHEKFLRFGKRIRRIIFAVWLVLSHLEFSIEVYQMMIIDHSQSVLWNIWKWVQSWHWYINNNKFAVFYGILRFIYLIYRGIVVEFVLLDLLNNFT